MIDAPPGRMFLALILASTLQVAACNDENDPTTSPTQAGPGVITTVRGSVANIERSGTNGLDVTFRIDDFTIVRAGAGTPVISGSFTLQTDAIRNGQRVTAEGRRTNGFLNATRILID